MTVTGPQDTTGQPKTLRDLLAEAEARDRIPVPQGASGEIAPAIRYGSEVGDVWGEKTPWDAEIDAMYGQYASLKGEAVHKLIGLENQRNGYYRALRDLQEALSAEFLGRAMREIWTGTEHVTKHPWEQMSPHEFDLWLEDGEKARKAILERLGVSNG